MSKKAAPAGRNGAKASAEVDLPVPESISQHTSMSTWRRFHLEETVKALAISENHRFFVQVREPPGGNRQPIEFYRWNLAEAKIAADKLVQAYYPHDCDEHTCGTWHKVD